MKLMIKNVVGLLLIFSTVNCFAQVTDTAKTNSGPMALSLEQAQAYAVQNSPVLKNANLDLEIAKKKVWETTAIGLPQVSGKLSASYIIKQSETIEQFSQLGGAASGIQDMAKSIQDLYGVTGSLVKNENQEAANKYQKSMEEMANKEAPEATDPNDMKWGVTLDVTVSQLIFSGAYFVGLQTTKAFKSLSEIAISKSKDDLEESVSNAYHLVLVMQENKKIMDSLYTQTLKIVNDMESMKKSGFVDEITVDQLKYTSNNLKNAVLALTNQVEVSKNLLRMQMGLDMKQEITLTDSLNLLIDKSTQIALATQEFKVDNNKDLKLMDAQVQLQKLNYKYQKTSLLPDIAAFYQFDHNFNDKAMSFTPPHLVGVGMNIPIFGSGGKMARISQAKLGMIKAENSKYQVSLALNLAYSDAKASYINALNKFDLNKENLQLTKKIFEKTSIKVKNGMASSMDLTQAQTQMLQAQSAYYSTVLELVNAKNKLDKLNKQ